MKTPPRGPRWKRGRRRGDGPRALVTLVAGLVMASGFALPLRASASNVPFPVTLANLNGRFPVGVADTSEPSGFSPPGPGALVGYQEVYVTDFSGASVPVGWDVFHGVPGGDPGGFFGTTHVVVANGLLALNAWRDPRHANRWVTGGLCQCGVDRRYGAYFVRSRITGPGPTEVELLWPKSNTWPPEVDFNETGGSSTTTSTSLHYGRTNHVVRTGITIDMTAWHTWGVIWTARYIDYTVDGRIWGSIKVPAEIPHLGMTLDFEQRQECEEHRQCPVAPESMLVDWVAEYVPT